MGEHAVFRTLNNEVVSCRSCPRLVTWREKVAIEKKAAYRNEEYWGRPVPGFGDLEAKILIVGLAPGAHGANRTGRMFTGDRSGEFLYGALYRAGLSNQLSSIGIGDGLELKSVFITSPVKCVPPGNKPTAEERKTCHSYFQREIGILSEVKVILALGAIGFGAVAEEFNLRPRPSFSHGSEILLPDGKLILCSYHVSQQNTFTGKLTEPMFDAVLIRAKELASC